MTIYGTVFSSFHTCLMYSFTCLLMQFYTLFKTVTTSFLSCTLFAVTGLHGSFTMYVMHKIYNLFNRFFWLFTLVFRVLLPMILPLFLLCCLTFLVCPLQMIISVVLFFPKMVSTMLNTSVTSSFFKMVF